MLLCLLVFQKLPQRASNGSELQNQSNLALQDLKKAKHVAAVKLREGEEVHEEGGRGRDTMVPAEGHSRRPFRVGKCMWWRGWRGSVSERGVGHLGL